MMLPLNRRNRTMLVLGIFLGVIIGIFIGCLVAPTLFYDQWIWKYYWGPVVADASGHTITFNGVAAEEGYTIISEITYGLILVCALYGLYQLLKKLKVQIDWYFCLALMPYILFGPVTRVLEDTNYFSEPAVYWFISPLIYLQTTVYVLFFLFLGYYVKKKEFNQRKTLLVILLGFILFFLWYAVVWTYDVSQVHLIVESFVFLCLFIVSLLPVCYRFIKKQTISMNTVVFSGGLLVVLPSLYLIARWILGDQWDISYGTSIEVFLLIIVLVTILPALVYLFSWVFRKYESFSVYRNPLNLSMLAGHLVDGFTSYISIYDPLNMGLPSYVEKHPASNGLMELWPPLFPIVKFLLIIVVIYLFDVLYKKELKDYSRLVNLLKIGILILGLSPGLRDLLRVTMGV